MQSIKSYTDLSQSKTLSKILPLESADMFYSDIFIDEKHKYNSHYLETYGFKTFEDTKQKESKHLSFLPCWSLAALLNMIPNYKLSSEHNYHTCTAETSFGKETVAWFDNPVDACYELILKLNELKML